MQGLTALIKEWAQNVADNVPASDIPDRSTAMKVWPTSWGTTGEQANGAPYASAMSAEPVNNRPAVTQRQTSLLATTQPAGEFVSTVLQSVDSYTEQGFRLFEKGHHLAVWRVPLPDFENNEEPEGDYKRVRIHTAAIKSGCLPVAVALQLKAVTQYVVRRHTLCAHRDCIAVVDVAVVVTAAELQETEFETAGLRKPAELIELCESMSATIPIPPSMSTAEESDCESDDEAEADEDGDEDLDGPSNEVAGTQAVSAPVESARETRIAARAAASATRKRPAPEVSSCR